MIKNEVFIFPTGYGVAWMDVGDPDLHDVAIKFSMSAQLRGYLPYLTGSELERKVGDTEQIALLCEGEVPAGLSDKFLKSVRWLWLIKILKHGFTE